MKVICNMNIPFESSPKISENKEEQFRSAVVGGGGVISPSVAAHARRTAVVEWGRNDRPTEKSKIRRMAAMGGGGTITPTVALHVRKKIAGSIR